MAAGRGAGREFPPPVGEPPCERCYWVVDEVFLAGAYPASVDEAARRKRISSLVGAGVRSFIDLTEEGERSPSGYPLRTYADLLPGFADGAAAPITHQRFAIRDLSVPDGDGMQRILDAIDAAVDSRRPVYVHCLGGVGRTGTVVCCWLLRHGFAGADDVIHLLHELRRQDALRGHVPAPETHEQISFVLGWGEERTP